MTIEEIVTRLKELNSQWMHEEIDADVYAYEVMDLTRKLDSLRVNV